VELGPVLARLLPHTTSRERGAAHASIRQGRRDTCLRHRFAHGARTKVGDSDILGGCCLWGNEYWSRMTTHSFGLW
jgi:hypothetical protein